ncbi:multiple epidermal growth factor-like domains protein 10 [Saccostrea cucullata]|uniref:multiple epidermal growth factor-like domains protein 10 n=1 Tax=Saccostrea cuccullata TaxID=36930 RepID=UPI002ED38C09
MKRKNGAAEMFMCFVGVLLTGYFISAYDNIALGKNASQQYPFFPFGKLPWGADKAVDGRYSNRAPVGEQCTISDSRKHSATWWVDLGEIFRIHHITIYYRTDNMEWDSTNGYTERFLGFSVYVSNTTNKGEGILCFQDTNYTKETIPSNKTIECVMNGQYVIYFNERIPGVTYPEGYSQYAFNELCELEVYGCNMSDVYGENCTLPCPKNCIEGQCNIVEGTCLGCIVGYKGSKCEDECDGWFYGTDCTISCGWCLNFEQCHHINGSCLKGCDIGFRGETCTQECPIGHFGYNCQESCSVNCGVSGRCNRVTGQCQGGCKDGWEGSRCDKSKNDSSFGVHEYRCNATCSDDCFNRTCNVTTGESTLVGVSGVLETNTYFFIGGALATVVFIVFIVAFIIVVRRRKKKQLKCLGNTTIQFPTENEKRNTAVYENMELNRGHFDMCQITDVSEKYENTEYQEIGQIRKSSHYVQLH